VTIDNPGITTYMVENLGSGTYYFVVQSFNSTGVLSSYSAEVARTIP
jgi:hypothetical protein